MLCNQGRGGALCMCGDMPPAWNDQSDDDDGHPDCVELCREGSGGALCNCSQLPPAWNDQSD